MPPAGLDVEEDVAAEKDAEQRNHTEVVPIPSRHNLAEHHQRQDQQEGHVHRSSEPRRQQRRDPMASLPTSHSVKSSIIVPPTIGIRPVQLGTAVIMKPANTAPR